MSTASNSQYGRVVLGLVGVTLGTAMFGKAARDLRWHPVIIWLALYGVGRLASQW